MADIAGESVTVTRSYCVWGVGAQRLRRMRQSSWAVPHNPVLKYCSMQSWRSWVGQFASQ
jgi:hypothetical protein